VAFFVGLSDNLGPVKEQTTVTFDRVVTNIGESYDTASGRFTAPVNGTYQFNVVISAQGRQKVSLIRFRCALRPAQRPKGLFLNKVAKLGITRLIRPNCIVLSDVRRVMHPHAWFGGIVNERAIFSHLFENTRDTFGRKINSDTS